MRKKLRNSSFDAILAPKIAPKSPKMSPRASKMKPKPFQNWFQRGSRTKKWDSQKPLKTHCFFKDFQGFGPPGGDQNVTKIILKSQHWPRRAPREAQQPPREPQEVSREPQEPPREPQEGSRPEKWPQNKVPEGPQNREKIGPDRSWVALGRPRGAREPSHPQNSS